MAGETHNEFSGQSSVTGAADVGARALALAVHAQWRHEAGLRGLVDPTPIPTGWRAMWGEVADHPENVGTDVAGDTGNLADFTRTFRGLRRRRLVILGGAGSARPRWRSSSCSSYSTRREPTNRCRCCCPSRRGNRSANT